MVAWCDLYARGAGLAHLAPQSTNMSLIYDFLRSSASIR